MNGLVDYGSDSSEEELEQTESPIEQKISSRGSSFLNFLPKPKNKPIRAKASSVFLGQTSINPIGNGPENRFDSDEDDEDKSVKPKVRTAPEPNSFDSSLLKLLPQPSNKAVKTTPSSLLLPSTVTSKQPVKRPAEEMQAKEHKKQEDEFDEKDDESTDFFGFNSADVEVPTINIKPMPTYTAPQAQIHEDAPMPGPSRPVPSSYEEDEDEEPAKKIKRINDEKAHKLIYNAEVKPWGLNDSVAREAVMNIREVNVDKELGPNVRETLLRNLNNKAMAQSSSLALPSVKKGPQDKMAKQKHQISYLAAQAVAREEQLQEQWADNKQKRMSTAKRYGFR
ncbi:hypothetical protein M3Y97_00149400 [Aphelenchoides bicaudatus]|nr:hypothetical protein M3Y97_00149400 [Aphelenchoides bicaudatus]